MAFDVTFNFVDAYNRKTTRTWHNLQALLANALLNVTTLADLYDTIGFGGLESVLLTQRSIADASAPTALASIDENVSVQVVGGDGYRYDFNLPMPNKAGIILADGSLNTADSDVTDFFDQFASGANWRINLRNPTDIATLVGGVLDK